MMEERKKLYSETRQDLLTRQLSNSQSYDRAILTLSTAGLGFSFTFIKDIVPLNQADSLNLLIISWVLFACTIFCTLISFFTSQFAIKKQLIFAEKYYLEKREEYLYKRNWLSILTELLSYFSMVVFLFALIFTIVFVSTNLIGGEI